MKILNLLMWVGQFGLSVIFPTLFFLLLAAWLKSRYSLGIWIFLVCGVLGFLTSLRTARTCLHSLRKAAEECANQKNPPISFNDHH